MVLYPYIKGTVWVFDDPQTFLKEEAFVCGMSEIIHGVVSKKKIHAGKGFKMTFSDEPFDHDIELSWFKNGDIHWEIDGTQYSLPGNWYETGTYFRKGPKAGWLCPALLKYFSDAPDKIYCKAEQLPAGINPVWGVSKATAYVLANAKQLQKAA